ASAFAALSLHDALPISMCTGLRGLVGAEITLRGPASDLHSGSFGGGVPNPLHAMATLLAGLHDSGGRITVPGFYDRVVPLTQQEIGRTQSELQSPDHPV